MFFEEGDDLIGTSGNTYAASYKGNQINILTKFSETQELRGLAWPPTSAKIKKQLCRTWELVSSVYILMI